MPTKRAPTKKTVAKTLSSNTQPKFDEIGYTFKIDVVIIENDCNDADPDDDQFLLEASVPGQKLFLDWVSRSDLIDIIEHAAPGIKKSIALNKIKETEELLAKLKKELDNF